MNLGKRIEEIFLCEMFQSKSDGSVLPPSSGNVLCTVNNSVEELAQGFLR